MLLFVSLFLGTDLPEVGKVLCRVGMVWVGIPWAGASDNEHTASAFSLLTHFGVQQESEAEEKLPAHLKYNEKNLRNGKNKNLRKRLHQLPPSPPIIPTKLRISNSIYYLLGGGSVYDTFPAFLFQKCCKIGLGFWVFFSFLSLACDAESDSHLENSPCTELFPEQLT